MKRFLTFFCVLLVLLSSASFADSISVEDQGNPYFQPIVRTYEQDANNDGTPDVISSFTVNSDGTVTVYVEDLIEQGKGKTQKWFAAICGESDIGLAKDEKGNDGSWVSTGSLNYAYLPNYGLPADWCPNNGNYGYVLSSAGNGDYEFRLHVSNPKDFEVYVGTGTQETILYYDTDKSVKYTTDSNIFFKSELYANLSENEISRINHDLWVQDGTVKKYGANVSNVLAEYERTNYTNVITINERVSQDPKGLFVRDDNTRIGLDFEDVCGIKKYRLHTGVLKYDDITDTNYLDYYSSQTYDANCSISIQETYSSEYNAEWDRYETVFNSTIITVTNEGDWFYDPAYTQTIIQESGNIYAGTNYESDENIHLNLNQNLGNVLTFDGINDGVSIPDSSDFTQNDFTILGSFKMGTQGSTRSLFSHYDSSGQRSWSLFARSTGVLQMYISDDGGSTDIKNYYSVPLYDDDKWHTVMITFSTTTQDLLFYVDGYNISVTKPNDANIASVHNSNANIYLGRTANGNYFDGELGNWYFYSEVLDAEDAAEYAINFTEPSDTNLVAQYPLNLTAEDVSGNGHDGTLSGGAWDYNVKAPVNQSLLYNDLVGYWSFDADTSSIAYDLTYNDNDLSFFGNTNIANYDSGYGKSSNFDGSSDYLRTSNLGVSGTEITQSAWIYVDTWSNYRQVLGQNYHSCATPYMPWHFQISSSSFTWLVSTGGGSRTSVSYSKTNIENKWFHAVGVLNGTHQVLYINGVEVNSLAKTGSITSTTGYYSIGGFLACGGGDWFDGKVDEVMVLNKALNATEISNIYNNQSTRFVDNGSVTYKSFVNTDTSLNHANVTFKGQANLSTSFKADAQGWALEDGYNESLISGLTASYHADGNTSDSSGNSNTATLRGNAHDDADGLFNKSFELDGNGDYVDFPSTSDNTFTDGAGNDQPFSTSTWVNIDAFDTNGAVINSKWQDSPRKAEWAILHNSVGNLIFYTYSSTAAVGYGVSAPSTITTGNWHHVVTTYDGSEVWTGYKVYIDGISLSTTQGGYGGTYTGMSNTGIPVNLGALDTLNGYDLDGKIDEALIFDKVLNEDEIKILYNKGLANWQSEGTVDVTRKNATHFESENAYLGEGKTNILVSITQLTDTENFYTPYLEGDVEANVFYQSIAPPFINLTLDITNPINTDILSGSSLQTNVTVNKGTVTYTYDLYRALHGYEAVNLTYTPNQTLTPNITGNFVFTVYGADNESTYANDSVSFTFISASGTEDDEMLAEIFEPFLYFVIGLLLAILGQYLANSLFVVAGGVWFIGLAAAVFLGTVAVPFLGGAFFALLGIGLIYHGGRTFLEEGI